MVVVVCRFPEIEDLVTVLDRAVEGGNRMADKEDVKGRNGRELKRSLLWSVDFWSVIGSKHYIGDTNAVFLPAGTAGAWRCDTALILAMVLSGKTVWRRRRLLVVIYLASMHLPGSSGRSHARSLAWARLAADASNSPIVRRVLVA